MIPHYDDIKRLFKQVLAKDYTPEQYIEQFTIRIPENLAKLDRVERIYRTDVNDTPQVVFDILAAQRKRLEDLKAAKGACVAPTQL